MLLYVIIRYHFNVIIITKITKYFILFNVNLIKIISTIIIVVVIVVLLLSENIKQNSQIINITIVLVQPYN